MGVALAGWLAANGWEFVRGYKNPEYFRRKYGSELGWITSVEIVSLGQYPRPALQTHFPELVPYRRHFWSESGPYVYLKKRITGRNARNFADLWRAQKFNGDETMCHEPAYVFRFFLGPWKRAEITVCWHCFNAEVPAAWTQTAISFNAQGTNGLALFDLAKHWAPLPTRETYEYTNPPVSRAEVKRLVAEASAGDYDSARNFSEYVFYSASRVDLEDEISSRLDVPSEVTRRWAAGLLADLGTPRLSRRLSHCFTDPDPWIRMRAGWALAGMDGEVDFVPVLSALTSTDLQTRTAALAAAARHGDSSPAELERLRGHVENAVSRYGTNTFLRSASGRRVKLTTERRLALKPLFDRLKAAGLETDIFREPKPSPRPEFDVE